MSTPARTVAVTTWYLEMRARSELRPARVPALLPRIERVDPPAPELNRRLYADIGGEWHWRDRLPWTAEQWRARVARPEVQTWVLRADGVEAGYVELERDGTDVEIAYFGLDRRYLGRGWGGHLLTVGIGRAWEMGAGRVWVHTCTLDHPAALANYRARGMQVYLEETAHRAL